MEVAIRKLTAACKELRRVSKGQYVSGQLDVVITNYGAEDKVEVYFRMYTPTTGHCQAETLAQALELTVRKFGPEELLKRAAQLIAEAETLKERARGM